MPTVNEILMGTTMGPRQSVANMDVIPLLAEEEDPFFAPPDFTATTTNYGEVNLRNRSNDGPTIVPPGTGFVTRERAQDHAVTGGALIKAGGSASLPNSCCIQETQPGLIKEADEAEMVMLPAPIRVVAIKGRDASDYSRLWGSIRSWKERFGLHGQGNYVEYLSAFKVELDEFVAEFEVIPQQVGAIVLIGGKVAGVERAPNGTFWSRLWEPLVRGCYGGLALQLARAGGAISRDPLQLPERSLAGIRKALDDANFFGNQAVIRLVEKAGTHALDQGRAESRLPEGIELATMTGKRLVGQVVSHGGKPVYASLCST